MRESDSVDAGQGWKGKDGQLTLSGWQAARRVVVRRPLTVELLMVQEDCDGQRWLGFIEAGRAAGKRITGYEDAVRVTNTAHAVVSLSQLYQDPADAENAFDALKTQWGWGQFMTHDRHRCRLSAPAVALAYNWWPVRVAGASAGAARSDREPAVANGSGRTRDFARAANDAHAVRVAGTRRAGQSGAHASIDVAAGVGKAACRAVHNTDRLAPRARPFPANAGLCRLAKHMLEDRLRHSATAVFRFKTDIRS